MIKKLSYIVLCFCFVGFGQSKSDSLCLKFNPRFGKQSFELEKKYVSKSNDTLAIETFKFYISSLQVQYTDATVFNKQNSYHLLDLEHPNSFHIPITKSDTKTISKIVFNIGVDSLKSVSGALSGDLDAVKGMYWAWQSGYINMKIEGESSSCSTRKNEFQFHIGGYLQPNYALRTVEIPIPISLSQASRTDIPIVIDLEKLFSELHLKETHSIMIPGKEAMRIADLSTQMFFIE